MKKCAYGAFFVFTLLKEGITIMVIKAKQIIAEVMFNNQKGIQKLNAFKYFLILLLLVCSHVSAATENEINHLLTFVGSTQCQYERNGVMHKGVEAVKHIKKKYKYYLDDINNTEDFIKYSATKSKMSGEYYLTPIRDKMFCNYMNIINSLLIASP